MTPTAKCPGRHLLSPACFASLLAGDLLAAEVVTEVSVPDSQDIGEVVVTGSRLSTRAIDANAPVTTLDRRDIERGGAASIGAVLQRLPVNTGSPPDTNVNDGGDGSIRVDLRGLGPQRTLVLLNGRRFPNGGIGGDSSVDLGTLPLSWIERVEVYAGGASAVYGADAVSGVVNIITRDAEAGIEFGGSETITGQGDGRILRGAAEIGWKAGRGVWSLGFDYTEQRGVTLDRRSYSAAPLSTINQAGDVGFDGSVVVPEGLFDVPDGNALGLAADFYTRVGGTAGQGPTDYRRFTLSDAYNFAPDNYAQTPHERTAIWLLGSRSLGGDTRLIVEGLGHWRESSQQAAPETFFSLFDPAPQLADGDFGVPAANYYNPFGVDLGFVTRRFVEADERHIAEEMKLWRALVGLEGTARQWRWRFSIGAAESTADIVESGLFARTRMVSALGPSGPDASGRIVCGPRDPVTGLVPATSVIAGCVPLNLFGGPGSITPEQLDYLTPRPLQNSGSNEQHVVELSFDGRDGRLFGRELDWAFGAEYRRDAGRLVRDPLRDLRFFGLVDADVSDAKFTARELYAEMRIPLPRERHSPRQVGMSLGFRASDFSSFDRQLTWQASLHWRPVPDISLRGNYARVFRAPALAELYEDTVAGTIFASDPCGNDPTPAQQSNCAANGVPGGAYQQGAEIFATIAGGNPALQPESGHSMGVGLVYRPARARSLVASVDWFSVELDEFIGSPAIEDVLFECAEHGVPDVCSVISRRSDGSISQVALLRRNFGRLETRGFDLAIDWKPETGRGQFHAQLAATYLEQWDDQPFPAGDVFHRAGWFIGGRALPRWRAAGSVDWRMGRWTAGYAAEFIGSMKEPVRDGPRFGTLFQPFVRPIASAWFHDLDFGFDFDNAVTLHAAILNATDEEPPFVDNVTLANTDVATYRLLGRTFHLELRYRPR